MADAAEFDDAHEIPDLAQFHNGHDKHCAGAMETAGTRSVGFDAVLADDGAPFLSIVADPLGELLGVPRAGSVLRLRSRSPKADALGALQIRQHRDYARLLPIQSNLGLNQSILFRWRADMATEKILSPYDGRVVGEMPIATAEDIECAIVRPQQAFQIMRKFPRFVRADILQRTANLIKEHRRSTVQTSETTSVRRCNTLCGRQKADVFFGIPPNQ